MPPKPEPDLDMACQAALGMWPCVQGAVSSLNRLPDMLVTVFVELLLNVLHAGTL